MKIEKRITAFTMALVMICAMLPVTLFPVTVQAAVPPEPDTEKYREVQLDEESRLSREAALSKSFRIEAATSYPVTITGKTAAAITEEIQARIYDAAAGDVVRVSGTKSNENTVISLYIDPDISVVWAADSRGLSFDIRGPGAFEVTEDGKIEVTGKDAITAEWGHVTVSGGEVSVLRANINDWAYHKAIMITGVGEFTMTAGKVSAFRNASAVYLEWGDVRVSGGELSVIGETTSNGIPTGNCYTIRIENRGTVAITGGKVIAKGATAHNQPVTIGWGLIAYLEGTCENDSGVDMVNVWYYYYGAAVGIQDWAVPAHMTQAGMTSLYGGNKTDAHVYWDTTEPTPQIRFSYEGYEFAIPWFLPEDPAGPINDHPVLLNGSYEFDTIHDAIAQATILGGGPHEIHIVGDVTEPGPVTIDREVTIIGDGWPRTVTLAPGASIAVVSGGKLTLGDDGLHRLLFTSSYNTVVVADGSVTVNDGVIVKTSSANAAALLLSGPDASGDIAGGRFEGNVCVALEKGAKLGTISGGRFIAREHAVYLTGADTKIDLISGGVFYQTESVYGHTVLVQNGAHIGEIADGYFEAVKGIALTILSSATVGMISGGEFTAPPKGTMATDGRNAAVWIQNGSTTSNTGIGKISGGHFYGSHFGVITMTSGSNAGSYIDTITGGLFEGVVGLQNDVRGQIGTISGGTFKANQGMLNVGVIDEINDDDGPTLFYGNNSYGIFNYFTYSLIYGVIHEIKGGRFEGRDYGIANASIIDLISGGTFIGNWYAISCDGLNKGFIEKITDGVFWGKNDVCIRLSYRNDDDGTNDNRLILEPALEFSMELAGIGRYQGGDGRIFNDESRVKFPEYDPNNTYRMSKDDDEEDVAGISETKFKYLTIYNSVTVLDSYAAPAPNGEGEYKMGKLVTIDAGTRDGCSFVGWAVEAGSVSLDNDNEETTFFTMPDVAVTVRATWECPPGSYMVTVYNSFASVTGDGSYIPGVTVNIDAGEHPDGYAFTGWTVDTDNASLDDADADTTFFIMPAENVIVTANWVLLPAFHKVEVFNSHAIPTGEGVYEEGEIVTIYAGIHPGGFSFAYWYTGADVTFDKPTEPEATFTMPAADVAVYAVWVYMPGFYIVTVENSFAPITGAGGYKENTGVTIDAGANIGNRFTGWEVHEGGASLGDVDSVSTGFSMPAADVTVEATWEPSSDTYTVMVLGSYAPVTGAGAYREKEAVYIFAGSRPDYSFTGWTIVSGTVAGLSPGPNSAVAFFTMPGGHVTVRANWYYNGDGGGGTDPLTPVTPPTEPEKPPIEQPAEPPGEQPSTGTPPAERPPMPPIPEGQEGEGEWRWDEETETWMFELFPPTAILPLTGDAGKINIFFLICIPFVSLGVVLGYGTRKRSTNEDGKNW